MKKNKILVIAAIVSAVILIAAGITIAVVLSGRYLDSMKDYNFTENKTYSGVEIVEDDGLFYLTKNGKKLSRTGYSYLEDVNSYYDNFSKRQILEAEDFEIYDYFLARKSDSEGYLLVNTDGDEIAIEGDSLMKANVALPYIVFKDMLTGEMGAISLDSLDSDLSADAGEEISINMFDEMYVHKLDNGTLKYDYLYTKNDDATVSAPSYEYFNADGEKLFVSTLTAADIYNIYNEDKQQIRYFVTGENNLYGLDGKQLASSVVYVQQSEEYLLAWCAPKNDALSAEQNALNAYTQVISWKVQYSIDNTRYDQANLKSEDNLAWVRARKDGVATDEYKLFNLITGDTVDTYENIARADEGLVRASAEGKNIYIDAKTGKILCQSEYADMMWFTNGMLASTTERAQKVVSITEKLPVAYLHVVKAGQEEKMLTLEFGQSIEPVVINDDLTVYSITSVDSWTDQNYSITSKCFYLPFSSRIAKTASYDSVRVFDVFSNAAPVAVGVDLAGGKYEMIDLASGEVIRTVTASGTDMAKTSIHHNGTYVLATDNKNMESALDIAVFSVIMTDDNGDVIGTENIALTRGEFITELGKYRTVPVTVTELGNDTINILGSTVDNLGRITSFSKYLTVSTSLNSTDVYALNEDFELEKLCTIPYVVVDRLEWGDTLDDVHFLVTNAGGAYGLYDTNGTQILAPVYSSNVYLPITNTIRTYGEYIIAYSRNAYGMFKYDAEKGKVKQVLDFEYEEIKHISDEAFLVQIGYDWYLYEGDDQVKKEPVIGGQYRRGVNISVNEETDALEYNEYFVVNIDGKFYIHRGESSEIVYSEFVAKTTTNQGYVDSGITVVNFRGTDGAIIETKILYPTAKSRFEFAMPDTEKWYSTNVKELQNDSTLVTEIQIEAMGSGIINVYKAYSSNLSIAG